MLLAVNFSSEAMEEGEEMWMSNNKDIGWNLILEHERVGEMGLVEQLDQTMQMTDMRARKLAKKCQYCDSTETLHWRKGYMLCNECISQYQFDKPSSEHNPLKSSGLFDPCSRSQLAKNVEQIRKGSRSCLSAKIEVKKCLPCESSLLDETEKSITSKQVWTRKMANLLDYGYPEVKKCMHCETTETPQWMTGPMDREILCNAYGLQCKDGRLFADYHPFKSPTFNPSLHFNKPKKVQKIRMHYTSDEEVLSLIPKEPKLKKVKEIRLGNSTYERDPSSFCKLNKIEMTAGSTYERDRNPTPKVKKVGMRKIRNVNDLCKTFISESKRGEEMTLVNINGSSLNLTSEAISVKEMSAGNYCEIRMGYTSEEALNPALKGPKLMKAKKIRMGDNTYERHPNFIPESKAEMTTLSTCERDQNPIPKVKEVEMRKINNIIDLSQTIISVSEKAEEMTLIDINGSSLNLTCDAKSVTGMSSGICCERDWNQAYRANSFQEVRQKANCLLESDFFERNKNSDFNQIIKRKPAMVRQAMKCTHCESTQTPLWREGPMGRSTLCNACGVQYKRGKLFPEYRPLKSPKYDPLLHSHLPSKVLKMRMRNTERCATSDNCE